MPIETLNNHAENHLGKGITLFFSSSNHYFYDFKKDASHLFAKDVIEECKNNSWVLPDINLSFLDVTSESESLVLDHLKYCIPNKTKALCILNNNSNKDRSLSIYSDYLFGIKHKVLSSLQLIKFSISKTELEALVNTYCHLKTLDISG